MDSPYRYPDEMKDSSDERVPASTRLKKSTREFLETKADKAGMTFAELMSNVLEDYAAWLRKARSGGKRITGRLHVSKSSRK
jgi:hypothetical protein